MVSSKWRGGKGGGGMRSGHHGQFRGRWKASARFPKRVVIYTGPGEEQGCDRWQRGGNSWDLLT